MIEQRRIEGERMEHRRQVMRKVNLKAKRFGVADVAARVPALVRRDDDPEDDARRARAHASAKAPRLELAEHERKIKLMVRKMSRSLMTHHLQNWNARVKKLNAQRSMVAGPMIRRAQQRVLARTVAWRPRGRTRARVAPANPPRVREQDGLSAVPALARAG